MQARDNPFATDRIERVLKFNPEWMNTTWETIETRWHELDRRATLTGRHGAGKTTFLDAWEKRLINDGEQVIKLFLNREKPTLSTESWYALGNCEGKIIFLDGEEQLGWAQRRKFYQLTENCQGLLITRHRNGKLSTLLHFEPQIQVLEHCVQQLAPEYFPQLSKYLPGWWQETNGNIRQILLACYDAVSGKVIFHHPIL